jgi:hypothetical protein
LYWVYAKTLGYLAHALGAPRCVYGEDSRFQFWRYSRPSELFALCLGPPKAGPHPLLNDLN